MGIFDNKTPLNPNDMIGSLEMSRIEIPNMKESANNRFINYGDDNHYPQYLVELSKTSALHRTLLENKAKLIAGDDITINGTPIKEWAQSLTGPTSIRIQNLIYNRKYPLRDWLKRTAYDYTLFGAYSTEVIWNGDFEYVKVMKHLDNSKVRSAVMNDDGEVDLYYYSNDWSRWNTKKMTPIPVFGYESDSLNQIIYKRDYYPDIDYYTIPSYIGGLTYINLDAELGLFNLSHIKNGMNPGLMFKVPYKFTSAEEKVAFINEFMNHFKGAQNNNNPLILMKNGEETWDVEKVETKDFDAQLIAINDVIFQQLIFAHRITNGALVGLLVPGKLGGVNSEELQYSTNQFNKFVIDPARLMLEETLEDVFKTHDLIVEVKII